MTLKQIFASNLLYLRENDGLSQQETAALLKVKWPRYQHWERGEILPTSPELLIAIVDLFKVTLDDMFRVIMINQTPSKIQ